MKSIQINRMLKNVHANHGLQYVKDYIFFIPAEITHIIAFLQDPYFFWFILSYDDNDNSIDTYNLCKI